MPGFYLPSENEFDPSTDDFVLPFVSKERKYKHFVLPFVSKERKYKHFDLPLSKSEREQVIDFT